MKQYSLREIYKKLQKLGLGCSYCYSNDTKCHIHHIAGRNIPDADNITNLSWLCPNCHTQTHEGKIESAALKNVEEYAATSWGVLYKVK